MSLPAPPAFGQTVLVAPGILWLRMPLPFALDHINLWLIEDGDDWAIIDTGVSDQKTRDLWQGVFTGPMAGRPVTRLISTHFHPDHMGLAAWLQRRFQVPFEAPLPEWLYGRMLSLDNGDGFIEASTAFYRTAGFDDTLLDLVRQRGNAYAARTRHIPPTCQAIRPGQRLNIGGHAWVMMPGYGHSPQMGCLYCADLGVLISGDQILPHISPNVSVWPSEPAANPLALFLASLDDFRPLPADTLVLPSHGVPFRHLHARLDELAAHHADRLQECLRACQTPKTARQVLDVLFNRPLDDHQLFFAIGESLAHLHSLVAGNKLAAQMDGQGVRWFAAT